jgi:hypothetical protein
MDTDLFACIISWSNGNKFNKKEKSDILNTDISFFSNLIKDYTIITTVVEVTFAMTIVIACLLTVFALLFVFGNICCGFMHLNILSKYCKVKFASIENFVNWIDFAGEIIMLILSIYSYISLKKTSNSVEAAIATDCFQSFTLSELNYFSKILDDFLDAGLQSILIFSSRIALFLVIFLTRIMGYIVYMKRMRYKEKKETAGSPESPKTPLQDKETKKFKKDD